MQNFFQQSQGDALQTVGADATQCSLSHYRNCPPHDLGWIFKRQARHWARAEPLRLPLGLHRVDLEIEWSLSTLKTRSPFFCVSMIDCADDETWYVGTTVSRMTETLTSSCQVVVTY
jgi:hypothetical protein